MSLKNKNNINFICSKVENSNNNSNRSANSAENTNKRLTAIDIMPYIVCMKGSVRQKGKKFYIDINNGGTRQRIFKYGDIPFFSKEQALQVLSNIRLEIQKGTFNPNIYKPENHKDLQFDNYLLKFYKHYEILQNKNALSNSYMKKVKQYIFTRFIPFFKGKDIRSIGNRQILEFYENLIPKKPGMKELSLKTQKNMMNLLQKVLKWAFENEDIVKIPKFPRISAPDPNWNWITEEEQEKIINEIPKAHHPIFIFLAKQGVRPGEARALKWKDIDWKFGTVKICRVWDEQQLKEYTKNKSAALIPLNDDVYKMLEKMRIDGRIKNEEELVFTHDGKHYSHSFLLEKWRWACKKADIIISLYKGTRHSLASQAINRGVPLNLISGALRHKDIKTTQRYAHLVCSTLNSVFNGQREKCHQDVTKKGF